MKTKLRMIIAGLSIFGFLLLPATPAEATTRLCFRAGSQVEGAVATVYVGGAIPVQKQVTLSATTFYKEVLRFQPDRYWRFKRVYGPGISSATVPRTYRTYNRGATWFFEWTTNQGPFSGVSGCSVAN